MTKQVTQINEIQHEGILLQARGEHVVRVLGALKEVPTLPGVEFEIWDTQVASSIYDQYHGGSLSGPHDDRAKPHHPGAVTFFVTRTGEVVFLEREWT